MNKKELRAHIARQKQEMSSGARIELSAPILRQLAMHPRFVSASTVLLYHSLPDEVDTHDFVRYWSTRKRILLPAVCDQEIELREYHPDKGLSEGRFGIQEPSGEPFKDYSSIDLAIIPGVAFDAKGNRLGRGKGFYDRLLSRLKDAGIYKIGICFPFQQVEDVPAEAHDIPMDEII